MCILFYIQNVRLFLGHTVYLIRGWWSSDNVGSDKNLKLN